MTVEVRGTLVSLEGPRKRHHGDPVRDQLGPVVTQPVLQLAHTVILLYTAVVTFCAHASPAVTVLAMLQYRIVGTVLVTAVWRHRAS